jgi:hypothetical protein
MTDEKYLLFRNKDLILSGNPRFYYVQEPKPPCLKRDDKAAGLEAVELPLTVAKERSHKRVVSSAFRAQSREQYYFSKVRSPQRRSFQVPPCGNYQVSYDYVDRYVLDSYRPSPDFTRTKKTPSRTGSIGPLESTKPTRSSLSSNFSSKSSSPTKRPSVVDFSKQTSRPPLVSTTTDVNEQRFISFDPEPPHYSKYVHIRTPSLDRCLPRSASMFPQPQHQPTYDTVYTQVEQDLGKGSLHFAKGLMRKSLANKIHDLEYAGLNYKAVEPRVLSPDFTRSLSRHGLPSMPSMASTLMSKALLATLKTKGLRRIATERLL